MNCFVKYSAFVLLLIAYTIFFIGASKNNTEFETTSETTSETITTTIETIETTTEEETTSEFVTVKLTAYCSCEKCCGKWARNRPTDENGNQIVKTASGAVAKQGVTVAADKSVFPFGTVLNIDGHNYTVQDTGSAVKGNVIDVYFSNHEDALSFGAKYANAEIVSRG